MRPERDLTGLTTSASALTALAAAVTAAAQAGAFIKSRLDAVKQVTVKTNAADVVTDVDPAAEQIIRRVLAAALPAASVLAEESVSAGADAAIAAAAAVAAAPALWIVDPLDGTTNFVAGMPLSVVSIGYAEHGVLQAGVVFDPFRDELFLAARAHGAHVAAAATAVAWADAQRLAPTDSAGARQSPTPLPGRRLTVSSEQRLAHSILATGFPARGTARQLTTEAGWRLSGRIKSMRVLGAAALHLAWVAAGRIDGFWEYDLNAWDLAGGVLLVLEAGGVVDSLQGGGYQLLVRDVLAAGQSALAAEISHTIVTAAAGGLPQ